MYYQQVLLSARLQNAATDNTSTGLSPGITNLLRNAHFDELVGLTAAEDIVAANDAVRKKGIPIESLVSVSATIVRRQELFRGGHAHSVKPNHRQRP